MFATVNIKKFPRGISDSVISNPEARTAVGTCTGSGPQDNNASFEGISEAEYNKRHMKALKDADPGLKLQASSTKRQAFEPTCSIAKRQASSPK